MRDEKYKQAQVALNHRASSLLDAIVTDYWLANYGTDHCTLCANRGIIDSRGLRTAAGVEVGRMNFCICPNGQALRKQDPRALDALIVVSPI